MHKAAAKQNKTDACLDETAEHLAQCIRFPMLSNDFLHYVVSQAGGILYTVSLRLQAPQWCCVGNLGFCQHPKCVLSVTRVACSPHHFTHSTQLPASNT